jgi:hypothetical protein
MFRASLTREKAKIEVGKPAERRGGESEQVRNDERVTMNDEEKHSSELMLQFIVPRSSFIVF